MKKILFASFILFGALFFSSCDGEDYEGFVDDLCYFIPTLIGPIQGECTNITFIFTNQVTGAQKQYETEGPTLNQVMTLEKGECYTLEIVANWDECTSFWLEFNEGDGSKWAALFWEETPPKKFCLLDNCDLLVSK